MAYQPKTGQPCVCKPGVERDNCPWCEGTGQEIDFDQIRGRSRQETVNIAPYPQGVKGIAAALTKQIERSRDLILEAETILGIEDGHENPDLSDDNPLWAAAYRLGIRDLVLEAFNALIEREEARIARIESGMADLSSGPDRA